MLIPLTFQMTPTGAIIMLTALFYGTQYGGTITSVLLNVPGEAASAITCIDGYEMAKQGRGGAALAIAAIGSFIGGTIATIALVLAAGPLTRMALEFGPVEFFALIMLGLSLLMGLAGKSMIKALMMGIFGMLLAMIGMDPVTGPAPLHLRPHGTHGRDRLRPGDHGAVRPGRDPGERREAVRAGVRRQDEFPHPHPERHPGFRRAHPAGQRHRHPARPRSGDDRLGLVVPVVHRRAESLQASGAVRDRHDRGRGGPETANNAHANGALIPLFTLGIPASPTVAVIMGAFMMHGLIPGPFLFKEHPDVVWGVIASFYVGNVILLILNLPLIGIWVKILKIPYGILFGIILAFMVVGAYSVSNSAFDVLIMTLFGVIGYLLRKLDFPLAPIVLTLILGPLMERSLRQSLEMSQGDPRHLPGEPHRRCPSGVGGADPDRARLQVLSAGESALSGDERA